MDNKKLVQILEIVKKRTEEGLIDWEATAERDAFRASFNSGMVTVGSYPREGIAVTFGPLGRSVFFAQLHDDRGRFLDEVQQESPQPTDLLPTLHALARRRALKPDDVADRLLEELRVTDDPAVA